VGGVFLRYVNSVRSEIDESDVIYVQCAPMFHVQPNMFSERSLDGIWVIEAISVLSMCS
jgi:hypothetical protein